MKLKKLKNKADERLRQKETFILCNDNCRCSRPDGKCEAKNLKECSVCRQVLLSQCSQLACKGKDGSKPAMVKVSSNNNSVKCIGKEDFSSGSESEDFNFE